MKPVVEGAVVVVGVRVREACGVWLAGALIAASLGALPMAAQAQATSPEYQACTQEQVTAQNARSMITSCSQALASGRHPPDREWAVRDIRAIAYELTFEDSKAEAEYRAALAAPTTPQNRALVRLQLSLLKLGQGDQAESDRLIAAALAEDATIRVAGVPDRLIAAHYVCRAGDRPRDAETRIRQCGRLLASGALSPTDQTFVLMLRGDLLQQSDDNAGAEKDYTAAIAAAPTDKIRASAYQRRGKMRVSAGNQAQGDADLALAAKLTTPPTQATAAKPAATQAQNASGPDATICALDGFWVSDTVAARGGKMASSPHFNAWVMTAAIEEINTRQCGVVMEGRSSRPGGDLSEAVVARLMAMGGRPDAPPQVKVNFAANHGLCSVDVEAVVATVKGVTNAQANAALNTVKAKRGCVLQLPADQLLFPLVGRDVPDITDELIAAIRKAGG